MQDRVCDVAPMVLHCIQRSIPSFFGMLVHTSIAFLHRHRVRQITRYSSRFQPSLCQPGQIFSTSSGHGESNALSSLEAASSPS
jgi:hypothetical protein